MFKLKKFLISGRKSYAVIEQTKQSSSIFYEKEKFLLYHARRWNLKIETF